MFGGHALTSGKEKGGASEARAPAAKGKKGGDGWVMEVERETRHLLDEEG